MLKALKSYWAFTNRIYRLVMWVFVPVVLVVGYILSADEYPGNSLWLLFGLFLADTASDFLFMGGAYYKGRDFSRFLLSSPKHLRLIREVTEIDIVRRVFVFQIPFLMECIYSIGDEGRRQWCNLHSFLPWLAILMAQSVVLVARHFIEWWKIHCCITAGFIVMMYFFVIFGMIIDGNVMVNGMLIVGIFMVSGATVCYSQKKGKERYYD